VRPGELLHRLRGRPQRNDEEPRVAVERDQLSRRDRPRSREARPDPRDEDDEETRQEHLRRVEGRLWRRDADAGNAHALRALLVAIEERVLAADAPPRWQGQPLARPLRLADDNRWMED